MAGTVQTHVYVYGWVEGSLVAMSLTSAGMRTRTGAIANVPADVATFRRVESALRDLDVRCNLNVIPSTIAARLRSFNSESLRDLIVRNPWKATPAEVKAALRILNSLEA